MGVLRSVDVTGLICLLNNTNPHLVVRLCNGPLEPLVAVIAPHVANPMRHKIVAKTIGPMSDKMEASLEAADRAGMSIHCKLLPSTECNRTSKHGRKASW